MIDREEVVSTALRAVLLQLKVGKESFSRKGLHAYEDKAVSPYAGSNVQFDTATTMVVGPWSGEGTYSVLFRIKDGGVVIEAHCEVSAEDDQITIIQQEIYVSNRRLGKRNVSVTEGKLHLWGSPQGFNYAPITDVIVMPTIEYA